MKQASPARVLKLTEHEPAYFARETISETQGALLYQRFGQYLDIEFPSPPTGHRWRIMPKGWVGAFPLDETTVLVAQPKLPVHNLARMLAVVYELPVHTVTGLIKCQTLADLYDQLAQFMASAAQKLLMEGIHHAYRHTARTLSAVRGRLDIAALPSRVPANGIACRFQERTGDVLENRAILWALNRVLRSGLCGPYTRQKCREVYRRFLSTATVTQVSPDAIRSLHYTRLTERYRTAHALSLLFLENMGPVAETGDVETVPFLLSMPALFEAFVAKWLDFRLKALGARWSLRQQERSNVGDSGNVGFVIDLVIYDDAGRAVCVLDTKYKDVIAPSSDDVAQIGYYALLKRCALGGLVYPVSVPHEWEGMSGGVSTFRTSFCLAEDLDVSGERFFASLQSRMVTAADKD